MEDKILEGLAYAIPSLVTGGVAFFIFNSFLKHEDNEKKLEALVAKKKESLPIKLQAYERLVLFCERINPLKLVLRVNPIGENKDAYLQLLIGNIEQEFEHNMVQQLYVSDGVWKAVIASKLAIINKMRQVCEESENAKQLRENILLAYAQTESPSNTAIGFIKEEVKKLL